MQFLKQNFHIFLLSLLVLTAWFTTLHLIHIAGPTVAAENLSWAREEAHGLIFALIGILVGYKIGVEHKDGPGSGDQK